MDRFADADRAAVQAVRLLRRRDAERVIVLMGSGAETARETIDHLNARGARLGVVQVHLFRPFSVDDLLDAMPVTASVDCRARPHQGAGRAGEPLYQDVITAFAEAVATGRRALMPRIVGGRYGLSSKEFTPAMVKAVFDNLASPDPKNHFTVGINDDVSHTSLATTRRSSSRTKDVVGCMFYGLGADGTVGANKNSIKIIGEETAGYAQGFFVYDSKKSARGRRRTCASGRGRSVRRTWCSVPGSSPATSSSSSNASTCCARQIDGAVFLLNSPFGPDEVWDELPRRVQEDLIRKRIRFYVIDADTVAADAGMGGRINTIMQTCFFAISGVLPREEAIRKIKACHRGDLRQRGAKLVEQNFAAVDRTLEHLYEVKLPARDQHRRRCRSCRRGAAVRPAGHRDDDGRARRRAAGQCDARDGTYPSGTTQWEKRNISDAVPAWEPASASSVATARWCARTRLSARATTTIARWRRRRRLRVSAARRPRLPEHAVHAAGGGRRLHGLRSVR